MEEQGDSGKLKWTPFLQNADAPVFEDEMSEQSAAFAIEENFVLSENKKQMVAAILKKHEPMVTTILEKYESMVTTTLEKYESKDGELAALKKKISLLQLEIKKQAENFNREKESLREALELEETGKKSLLDENLALKAAGEVSRIKILESANLNAKLAEKIANLERELEKLQREYEASAQEKNAAISESAHLNLKTVEQLENLKRERELLKAEVEREKQEKKAAIFENEKLKNSVQSAQRQAAELASDMEKLRDKFVEIEKSPKPQIEHSKTETTQVTPTKGGVQSIDLLDSGFRRNDEPEQLSKTETLRIQLAPLEKNNDDEEAVDIPPAPSIDFSMEPEWMRALASLKEPIAAASARVKQLAAVRLPEGPRTLLGLALGSLAQASDTLRVIGEFLNESPPPNTPERLETALDASAGIWEGVFRRKRILISRSIPAGLPAVSIASISLRTVFYQIFRNAFEAMPKGGTLKITAEEEPENGQVKIVFADTGPGFSDAALAQIFIPFTFSRAGHLGLGLSLARRILRRAAGDIEVENLKPQGAAVILRFPSAGQIPVPPLNLGDK